MVLTVIQLIQKTVSKTPLPAKWQTTDCLETLIGCFFPLHGKTLRSLKQIKIGFV